ncbi:MAG: ribosome recycling factor [Pseudomonadota bacterium]
MEEATLKPLAKRMDGAIEALRRELGGLRTGRASPSLLDPVSVEVYGQSMPLNQVGTVGVPEPRMLTVTVWDKGSVKAVEKAIRDSGLGLNPQADGTTVRIPIPELNEERRRELVKVAGKYAEQARVAIRNVRRDGMDDLKKQEKNNEISQDEHRGLSDRIQKMTDDHVVQVDEIAAAKEAEIMQV